MRRIPTVAAIFWAFATLLSAQSAGTLQFVPLARSDIGESEYCGAGIICENFIRLNVIRVGGTTGDVTVDVVPTGGTAVSGVDYDIPFSQIFFRDGFAGPQSVLFVPRRDNEYEGDETAVLSLSNPTGGATIGAPSSVNLVIHDTSAGAPGDVIVPTLRPGVLAFLAAALAGAGILVLSRRA